MDPKELRKNALARYQEARKIAETAKADNREMTEDEDKRFHQLVAEARKIEERAAALERIGAAEERQRDQDNEGSERRTNPNPLPHEDPGNTRGGQRPYSLLAAMRSAMLNQGRVDGLEGEVSAEIARRSERTPQGFFMPLDLDLRGFAGGRESRANDVTTTTGAGAVQTITAYGRFIELLRSRVLLQTLGATIVSGLVGKLSVPKQTGGATVAWVDEGTAPAKSNATIGQVPLEPKSIAAYTGYSRKLLLQTAMDVEAFILADIARSVAIGIDKAGFNGSGVDPEPEGVLQNSSVPTVALGTNGDVPTFAKFVEMETTVAISNADLGDLAYVTTPTARGKMKSTLQDDNVLGRYLWAPMMNGVRIEGEVNGYPAWATNHLPSDLTKASGSALSAAIFGNWNDVLIGLWGGLDILVNPYSEGSAGNVLVHAFQDADVALRHAESFAKIVDMVTA